MYLTWSCFCWTAAVPGTPPLFQTGLSIPGCSVGTSGGVPIEAAFMLLPRYTSVHAF